MKVDIKTSSYFSTPMMFSAITTTLTGLLLLSVSVVTGLVLLLLSLMIFTTHYRLAVDFDNKTFYDYLWILGTKHGEKGKFEEIQYIFIKKSKVSQTMSLRAATSTIKKEVYDAYLRFSDTNKIHLMTIDDKQELTDKVRVISDKLKTKIIDYSDGDPKEI